MVQWDVDWYKHQLLKTEHHKCNIKKENIFSSIFWLWNLSTVEAILVKDLAVGERDDHLQW